MQHFYFSIKWYEYILRSNVFNLFKYIVSPIITAVLNLVNNDFHNKLLSIVVTAQLK